MSELLQPVGSEREIPGAFPLLARLRGRAARYGPGGHDRRDDMPGHDGPVRRYLIATTPRAGGEFLTSALRETDKFGRPEEYLHPAALTRIRRRYRTADPRKLLDALQRDRTSRTGWFGLKAQWAQVAPCLPGRGLQPLDFDRAALVWRRDLLDQAISFLLAQQTRRWSREARTRGISFFSYDRVVLLAEEIRRQNECWMAALRGLPPEAVTTVAYEDLLKAPDIHFHRVTALIDPGCATSHFIPTTRRQRGDLNRTWRGRFVERLRKEHKWILQPQEW